MRVVAVTLGLTRDLWALPYRWLKLQVSVYGGGGGYRGRGDGDNEGRKGRRRCFSISGPSWRLSETGETGKAGYSAERWKWVSGPRRKHALPEMPETSAQQFTPVLAATCRRRAQAKHTVGGSENRRIA